MSSAVQASAPGKLILLGEYAVLEGAPAVVMAVDRRARVTLRPAAAESWTAAATGLMDEPADFRFEAPSAIRWRRPTDAARLLLVDAVLRLADVELGVEPDLLPPLDLDLDTTAFFVGEGAGRRKLGLGSSAALTVALAGGLTERCGAAAAPGPEDGLLQRLVRLHRAVQGGRGSGVDVAASLLGGVLEFRLEGGDHVPMARRTVLPEGLQLACVWTGRAASTVGFLERLEARRSAGRRPVDAALAALGDASEAGVAALRRADVEAFLDAVDGAREGFESLGRAIDMPVVSPEHAVLHSLCRACGVRYKPSGAGGGDFGIACAADPEALDELTRRATAAGFTVPAMAIDAIGLKVAGM